MYVKFLPSQYIFRYRKGKLIHQGVGLSFFFFEQETSAMAIPVTNQDTDFIFEEMTFDFQKISIQGQMTYRITDYAKISGAFDFTMNLKTKQYYGNPMQKLAKRMTNIAESFIKSKISKMQMTQAIPSSLALASDVWEQMRNCPELTALGVSVTGFSILKISANAETSRAFEARTREQILKQSDDAIYERRNASIEQERHVKENELNTEICLKEKQQRIQETENQLQKIRTLSEAEREELKIDAEIAIEKKRQELAELRFQNAKKDADAEAYRIQAIMQAYSQLNAEVLIALATLNMNPETLLAQAFEKLAGNSEKIGTLNITPDFLQAIAGKRVSS